MIRATIYFRDDLDTSPLVGAVGFAFFSLAMAVGRLYSDTLGETYTRSQLLRCGGGLGAGGLGLSVLAPSVVRGTGVIVLAVIGLTLSGNCCYVVLYCPLWICVCPSVIFVSVFMYECIYVGMTFQASG